MRTTLIIPALNEAPVIGAIVTRVPRECVDEVIVVDNGSTDGTGVVAEQAGARVVSEPRRGYGAACWAGVSAIAGDTEVVAFLDGDGSQRPEELPRVLSPLEDGGADLVLGARRFAGGHPFHAALGTRLVAAFVSRRYGWRITDIGPLRAIRVDLLRRLGMRDRAFGWPVEMVVKAAALHGRLIEVPVSHEPRLGGRSKVSGTVVGSVRAGYGFLRAAVRAAGEVSRSA
ncbi:MAG TPA: glycosyltransferase family 2 protein [Methylomirabilota bacterium]|jgi:glycosyltransferase involved in cell wall biosynthesis|nr:glycosyltransferase family 2 protein [Methylomirabilota bacterium]